MSEKRVSTVDPAGPSVPMGKLSRRRRPDEDAVEPTNYLYPRIPSSRMGTPHLTTSIADSSHRITFVYGNQTFSGDDSSCLARCRGTLKGDTRGGFFNL